jgi:hypothetical protein
MIDLNSKELLSSKEASLLWGKHKDYVRYVYNNYPNRFPKGSIRKLGSQLVVTQFGMEKMTQHKRLENVVLKKNIGNHLSAEQAKVISPTNSGLAIQFKNGDRLEVKPGEFVQID